MFSCILIPLDGSSYAEHALALAPMFMGTPGTTLILAHVHTTVVPVALGTVTLGAIPVYDEIWDQERREHERVYLDTQAQCVSSPHPVIQVLLDGPVAEALVRYVQASNVDLVVMTTHGAGGWESRWLGSTAHAFIHASHVPVLLVSGDKPRLPREHAFGRILLSLDGSTYAEQIIDQALLLPVSADAEYILVRIVSPFTVPRYPPLAFAAAAAHEATEGVYEDACTYLEDVAERLRRNNLRVRTQVVLEAHTAQAILDYAREIDADVIALTTHGRGFIQRLLLGSVADKVVRGADRPVLLFRPKATASCMEPVPRTTSM
jgi:nucleotide-binding universal stress UspA family protein